MHIRQNIFNLAIRLWIPYGVLWIIYSVFNLWVFHRIMVRILRHRLISVIGIINTKGSRAASVFLITFGMTEDGRTEEGRTEDGKTEDRRTEDGS